MSEASELDKAEARVVARQARVARIQIEKTRLVWLHLILIAVVPAGFHSWWLATWVGFAWLMFWGAGAYMNFFHLREAQARLRQAEAELQAVRQP